MLYLHYAWNNRICCDGYDLNRTSDGPTRIHYRANSETAIWSCSLKYNFALKSRSSVKVQMNVRLLLRERRDLASLDSTTDFFIKFVELLKSSTVKVGLNVIFLSSSLQIYLRYV